MRYSKEFLTALDQENIKTIYSKIVAYDINEQPIEWIHGYFTGGSINIDGTSSVRRSCSLTMVTQDKFNEYIWVPKTRFKLYIGVKNTIQRDFPRTEDIIWFNQGEYIITSFGASVSTQGHNINLSGKDKMCLLNGEISGSFEAQTDLGIEEIVTKSEDGYEMITRKKVPIKTIIRKMIQHYACEPAHNIIINDVEDYGLELLNYYGDTPMYAFKQVNANVYTNVTFNDEMVVNYKGSRTTLNQLESKGFTFNTPGDGFIDGATGDSVKIGNTDYTILRIKYGEIAGYKLTELVYPDDLIANIGDNVCTILDRIISIFSEFEYFYDVDGHFVFQKKKLYTKTSFTPIVQTETGRDIPVSLAELSPYIYNLYDNKLISSISNNSTIPQVKNDFSIWGERNQGDAKIAFHLRYAVSEKPVCYKTLELTEADGELYKKLADREDLDVTNYAKSSVFYYTKDYTGEKPEEAKMADWRELIYQMANDYFKANYFDDFTSRLVETNKSYENVIINGKTGYEHFYTDIQGFWRYLYAEEGPEGPPDDDHTVEAGNGFYWNNAILDPDTLLFWFDFLPNLGKVANELSIQQIGDRLKTTNNKISTIYHEIPTLIYYTNVDNWAQIDRKTGYDYIHLTDETASLLNISSNQGSAFDILNDQLQNDFFERQSISLNTIAIYYLEPNNIILLQDKEHGIEGEYAIKSLSYSLGGGTMSINANSVPAYVK